MIAPRPTLAWLFVAKLLPAAAAAGGLPRDKACFERVYDRAHLAANPGQQVRRIRAIYSPDGGDVQVHLDVWLRGDPVHYSMYADCAADGAARRCTTDLDGGWWRVEASPRGGLRVANGGLWVNPDAADSQTPLPEGRRLADRRWALAPMKACPVRAEGGN